MSPKKDANKVIKTPSKRKATQSPTSSGPYSPNKHVYDSVNDLDFIWAVLYEATDFPKPNYQRASELLGMPYKTVFGRFARIKKGFDGTPAASPTTTSKPRKAPKSEAALKSEVDAPMTKDTNGFKSDVKAKIEVEAKHATNDEEEA
ncbi:uncharacterized protein N7477_005778 [Penicillium maclennaniae]|uniref:uncharacterized protein n=1 Tax=Penicillium maclennaniae TaxID=1343394 RepID=UPI0025414889|nr:uncharacterized protein N7477_005778 [Penicillium maclennaniae]KAJ5670415.1 hypothetical protein N7477_005778 [Penicillium maclennaniae]